MSDIDPAIAEIVRIALVELRADFKIVRTTEDEKGVCARLKDAAGKDYSACIDWSRNEGSVKAIELFKDRISRFMK